MSVWYLKFGVLHLSSTLEAASEFWATAGGIVCYWTVIALTKHRAALPKCLLHYYCGSSFLLLNNIIVALIINRDYGHIYDHIVTIIIITEQYYPFKQLLWLQQLIIVLLSCCFLRESAGISCYNKHQPCPPTRSIDSLLFLACHLQKNPISFELSVFTSFSPFLKQI